MPGIANAKPNARLVHTVTHMLAHPRTRTYAKTWVKSLTGIASLIELNFVSIALGFSSPLKNGFATPIVNFAESRPVSALLIGALLVVVSVLSWRLAEEHHEEHEEEDARKLQAHGGDTANGDSAQSAQGTAANPSDGGRGEPTARKPSAQTRILGRTLPLPAVALAALVATLGYLLFFVFVGVALARPMWCPGWLCATQLPAGTTADSNLALRWQTFQSPSYVIPGDPVAATAQSVTDAQDQAGSVVALRVDIAQPETYRVVISARNLQSTGYPIRIEQVTLLVVNVPPMPQPLNVTTPTAGLRVYDSNPYVATYSGQRAGALLPTTYTLVPGGHVELAPYEADDLDIQVTSKVPVELQFQVEVTYRFADESQTHTLTLKQVFTVVFANAANWHPWSLQQGRLVPQS